MFNFDKKKVWQELKKGFKDLKERYINHSFYILLAGVILFYTLFKIFPNSLNTFKVTSTWGVFFTYFYFCYYNHWRYDDWKSQIFTDVFYLGTIFMSALAFTAISVNEGNAALNAITLFILWAFGSFVVISATSYLRVSRRDSKLLKVILVYTIFAISVILFFVTLYALFPTKSTMLVAMPTNSTVTEFNDFLYYSASNFYTSTYGDILPIGDRMRLISLIQVLISFIVHVIAISRLVPVNPEKKH